jgi:hypothetical protein
MPDGKAKKLGCKELAGLIHAMAALRQGLDRAVVKSESFWNASRRRTSFLTAIRAE